MVFSKETILTAISEMSVIELCDLIKMMEKKFNVLSTQQDSVATSSSTSAMVEKSIDKKISCNVILTNVGVNKLAVIKLVRSLTNLGLKESKNAVENVPFVLKESLSEEDANKLVKQIEQAGAKAILQ